MTHEERLALIYKPMPWRVTSFVANAYPCSYPWAGTIIGDAFPVGRSGEDLLDDEDDFGTDPGDSNVLPSERHRRREDRRRSFRASTRDHDKWQKVIEATRNGLSIAETAALVGFSPNTVSRIRRRLAQQDMEAKAA